MRKRLWIGQFKLKGDRQQALRDCNASLRLEPDRSKVLDARGLAGREEGTFDVGFVPDRRAILVHYAHLTPRRSHKGEWWDGTAHTIAAWDGCPTQKPIPRIPEPVTAGSWALR